MPIKKRWGRSFAVGLVLALACTRPDQTGKAQGPCGDMDATPTGPPSAIDSRSEGSGAATEEAIAEATSDETLALPVSTEASAPSIETTVAPGINEDYLEAKNSKRIVARLERDGREVHDQKKKILRELAPKPGMIVADIGAGTGLFTLDLAQAVGQTGKVYAVELAPTLVEHLSRKAKKAGLDNVIPVQAEARDAKLPAGAVDLALMADVYHHIEYPRTYMKTVLDGLRPGGVLFVIDFKRIEGESDPWRLEHVRAGQDTVRKEIQGVGFELVEEREPLEEHYILQFRRPGGGGNEPENHPSEELGAIL